MTFPDRAREAAETIREAVRLGYCGAYAADSMGPRELERIADMADEKAADEIRALAEALTDDLLEATRGGATSTPDLARALYDAGWRKP